jgi:hypothetical protein
MKVEGLTPILNVSNIEESFAWFAKLVWEKAWDWGKPPTFGAVCSGETQIFLCQLRLQSHPSQPRSGDILIEQTLPDESSAGGAAYSVAYKWA